jgi:hypothetical protein
MDILSLARMVATRHSWGVVPAADGGCRIEVRTEAMRTQVVQLSPGQDPDGRPILWVWSVICETSGVGDPWYLLRLNATLTAGSVAVRDPNVIMVETLALQSLQPPELERAITWVARNADSLEKQVHGSFDRN